MPCSIFGFNAKGYMLIPEIGDADRGGGVHTLSV